MILFQFGKNKVVIPLTVIEELDKFKKNQDELGRNARTVIKKIDKLIRKSAMGQITEEGVKLDNGGILVVEPNHTDTIPELDRSVPDNRILSTAKYYYKKDGEENVKLLSKDANLRIKANIFKIKAEDYDSNREFSVDDKYLGYRTLEITKAQEEALYQGKLKIKEKLYPNEYVVFTKKNGEIKTPIVAKMNSEGYMVALGAKNAIFDIGPRNIEQQIAVDLLLNPDIPLITITGKAGTGKTLLTVASALEQVLNQSTYSRILISRPVVPMGKDIGFLPGSISEKLDPWMQPIYDNLDYLFNAGGNTKRGSLGLHQYKTLIEQGVIQVEPLMYIRGRSIPNQIFILDESQNLSKHEIKTILSRVGEGTKIILTGDPDQIDNPHLDKVSCGLSQVVEKFKTSSLAGHITLNKGERSALAEAVVELFK